MHHFYDEYPLFLCSYVCFTVQFRADSFLTLLVTAVIVVLQHSSWSVASWILASRAGSATSPAPAPAVVSVAAPTAAEPIPAAPAPPVVADDDLPPNWKRYLDEDGDVGDSSALSIRRWSLV